MGARAASTLSLLLLAYGPAAAQDFSALRDAVRNAPPERVVEIVANSDRAIQDPEIADALTAAENATDDHQRRLARRLVTLVELKAFGEGKAPDEGAQATAETAKRIKTSSLYRDAGVDEESNWLGRALSRLRNIRLSPFRMPDGPRGVGLASFGSVLIYLVWGLLGAVGIYLLYLALRHVRWRSTLARRAKAILEEDEPERTLDEWLAQADALAAEGKHREAVRALYLACLLRFDEHRVARFIRGETNWEHLARIHASERRPTGLDFRPATQAFDRIWYGKQTRGMADVERFRAWYQEITAMLAKEPA